MERLMVDSIVIVGGGLAAARVVRSYREAGGRSALTILSSDTHLPYNRPPLSKGFLRGELEADAVFLEPDDAYAGLEVEVRLGTTVVAVDTLAKRVAVADGAELGYDRLVLASGSLPRPLGVPGRISTASTPTARSTTPAPSATPPDRRSGRWSSAPASSEWRPPPPCAAAASR
jgi:NAD(P)H-nitrite reductase large subunit